MEFSTYQIDAFDWLRTGRGDALIEAVAGSGKTFLLEHGAKIIQGGPVLCCAFNKTIAQELGERLGPNATCQTINSIGHRALLKHLGRVKMDFNKYGDIVYELTPDLPQPAILDNYEVRSALGHLVGFVQTCFADTDDDSLADLVEHYGIEFPTSTINPEATLPAEWYFNKCRAVLTEGERMARIDKVIAFNDQIWLPNLWNLTPAQFPFVFVDECQDLSKGKLELILRCRAPGGRMLFVGDPRQSIYGFAGADPAAWQTIIQATGAIVLPLSVTYRCPTSHVELAQTIVPQIEARPGAPVGTIRHIKLDELTANIQSNDLVICRTTAPLIQQCFECIKARIPARVAGRDIGKQLVKLGQEAAKLGPLADFVPNLETVVKKKIEAVSTRKNGVAQGRALEDRRDGLIACYDALVNEVDNFNDFWTVINALFNDGESIVTFSTVHRIKGLQRKRVLILRPDLLMKFGKQDWEVEQEANLAYVAYTRSTDELIFVDGQKKIRLTA